MAVALRDALNPASRRWLEQAYSRWLGEVGASVMEVGRAAAAVAALLESRETHLLLIERDGVPAGFAVVREHTATRRIDEFYVDSALRRLGVGREAARLLLERFAGEWEVVTLPRDISALQFWRAVLREHAPGRVTERHLGGQIVQRFSSRGAR